MMWVKCNQHNFTDTDIFMVKYISILNLCVWVSAFLVLYGNGFQIEIVVFKLKERSYYNCNALHCTWWWKLNSAVTICVANCLLQSGMKRPFSVWDCIVCGSCHRTIKFCIIHSSDAAIVKLIWFGYSFV